MQRIQSLPPTSDDVLFCCWEPRGDELVSRIKAHHVKLLFENVLFLALIGLNFFFFRWLNKLGLASIQYEPTERNPAVGEQPWQSEVYFFYAFLIFIWAAVTREVGVYKWVGVGSYSLRVKVSLCEILIPNLLLMAVPSVCECLLVSRRHLAW